MVGEGLGGAVANYIGTMQDRGALNAQRKQTALGGVAAIGGGLAEAYGKKKMADALVAEGYTPEEAQVFVAAGPRASVEAIADMRDRKLKQEQGAKVAGAMGVTGDVAGLSPDAVAQIAAAQRATKLAEQSRSDQFRLHGFASPTGSYDPKLDPAFARGQAAREAEMAAALKEDQRVGGMAARALAPRPFLHQIPLPPGAIPGIPKLPVVTPRQPTEGEALQSLQREPGGASEKALERVQSRYPVKAFAPPQPRNIDPLSTEGIAAAVEKARRIAEAEGGGAPKGPDQRLDPSIIAVLAKKSGLPAESLAGLTYRAWDAIKTDPDEEMLKQLRVIAAQTSQAEHQPPDEETRLLKSMATEEQAQFDRLKKLATEGVPSPIGGKRPVTPKDVEAFNAFVAQMRQKYPASAPPPAPKAPPAKTGSAPTWDTFE